MRAHRVVVLLVCVAVSALLPGCPDRSSQVPDAGPAEAPDAGPPPPVELTLAITADVPDAGTVDLALTPDTVVEVPQPTALTITTNLQLRDFRIRIVDEGDRGLVSDDVSELAETGNTYRIVFPEPLKTGYRYAVVVDSQSGGPIEDAAGRTHSDLRLPFKVAGERQKPPPPPKKRRR